MKKVINKSDTAIWITPKLAALRATNHPVITLAINHTIRTIQLITSNS